MLLAALMCLTSCGRVALATELDPEVAYTLFTQLQQSGVHANLQEQKTGRTALEVESADIARAFDQLKCAALADKAPCEPAKASLLPTPRQESTRLQAERECQLSKDLLHFPGVHRSRVRLSIAESSAIDTSLGPVHAAVWLETSGDFEESSVRDFLRGSVAGLEPAEIHLITSPIEKTPPNPSPRLAQLGPLRLAPESLPLAKLGFAILLGINLLMALTLGIVWHRRRR